MSERYFMVYDDYPDSRVRWTVWYIYRGSSTRLFNLTIAIFLEITPVPVYKAKQSFSIDCVPHTV